MDLLIKENNPLFNKGVPLEQQQNLTTFFKDIKDKFDLRSKTEVTYCDIFKQTYCCYTKKPRDYIICSAMEYIDNGSEISSLVKLLRNIEIHQNLLLRKYQEEKYFLPSLNVDEGEEKPDNAEEEDEIDKKLNEDAITDLGNWDYEDRTNKKIAKNMIKSIV